MKKRNVPMILNLFIDSVAVVCAFCAYGLAFADVTPAMTVALVIITLFAAVMSSRFEPIRKNGKLVWW